MPFTTLFNVEKPFGFVQYRLNIANYGTTTRNIEFVLCNKMEYLTFVQLY
jgi:hypothetical protein